MAAPRKAISKKTRFDVFKRDGFTCQYCGAHPPEVVLHIDHIIAVAEGGTSAGIARARMPWGGGKMFRYFCGVCWRKIRGE